MPENYTPRVKRLLREGGCEFVRQGKGDHEIWDRRDGRRFMVDNQIKTPQWANVTLRAAGLPKAF